MSSSENNDSNSRNRGRSRLALISGVGAIAILAAVLFAVQPSGSGPLISPNAQSLSPIVSASAQTYGENGSQLIPIPSYYHGNYWGPPSTISTSGSATTMVDPDKFSVTVGVDTNGTTAENATSKNADLMAQVVAALKGLGIKDNQMSTSSFSVSPIYGSFDYSKVCPQSNSAPIYCPPSQVIIGYRASNSITVTLDTAGSIDAGKVIDSTVKAGANNVFGVNFFLSPAKQQETRDNLTQTAIANAKHRADIAAASVGMQVSGVQSINLNDVYFPVYSKNYDMSSPMAAEGANQTPIQPGQQDVSTTVNVVFYFATSSQSSASPSGMMATKNNTNCTNPPGGPMIC